MGVGSISSMNNMVNLQTTKAGSPDIKSKNIQNEITEAQQQMQKLSSQEDLSVDEKADEKKKLQKEISSLNTELERQQDEFLRAQKREMMLAELRQAAGPTEEEEDDEAQTEEAAREGTSIKTENVEGSDAAAIQEGTTTPANGPAAQAGQPGTVIVRNSDGVVILKGEMSREEKNAVSADETQADETEEEAVQKETEREDDETSVDTGLTQQQVLAMVSADTSLRQAGSQETAIDGIRGDAAVLSGEKKQDERRGVDTDEKQAQIEKLREKEEKARIFQMSVLGEANTAMKPDAEAAEENAFVRASKVLQDEEAQQRFYVSVG